MSSVTNANANASTIMAPSPVISQEEIDQIEEPVGALAGRADREDADEMEVTEAMLEDPELLKHINRSLAYKELVLRKTHADELVKLLEEHSEELAKPKKAGQAGEAPEPPEAEEAEGEEAEDAAANKKHETGKLKTALKEQGRQEGRLVAFKKRFIAKKLKAKKARDARFAGVRAAAKEDKALDKIIQKAIRDEQKKHAAVAQAAAKAAREKEGGSVGSVSEAAVQAAMEAYRAALNAA